MEIMKELLRWVIERRIFLIRIGDDPTVLGRPGDKCDEIGELIDFLEDHLESLVLSKLSRYDVEIPL